jgi:hypothetical protein
VSAAAARELYGAVVSPDGSVDHAATERRRTEMRCDRSRTNITAVTSAAGMRHPACEARACPANGAAKERRISIRERLMSKIGPAYTTGPKTTLSEIICTECGALLDAQVTLQGVEPLFDGQEPEGQHS